MTMNFKALSLLVLTSIALGTLADGSRHSSCDCAKKERKFCKDKCCTTPCKKNCKTGDQLFAFEACLSFEQVVDANSQPRPAFEKPAGICGHFRICFAQDLSSATFELQIFGDDSLKLNARPVGALLLARNATTPPGTFTPLAFIAGLDQDGNGPTCEEPADTTCSPDSPSEFRCRGTITNDDLNNTHGIISVAELFTFFTRKEIVLLVNGNNTCGGPFPYGQNTGGLIRGQLVF